MHHPIEDAVGAALLVLAFGHALCATLRRRDFHRASRFLVLVAARYAIAVLAALWFVDGFERGQVQLSSWTGSVLMLLWVPAVVGGFFQYWLDLSQPVRTRPAPHPQGVRVATAQSVSNEVAATSSNIGNATSSTNTSPTAAKSKNPPGTSSRTSAATLVSM